MNPQQQVFEAAMLARMVGTHLNGVDNMTVERSNNQANKIDMQRFVAPLMGGQVTQNSPVPVDLRMEKAVRDAELLALQQVPDTSAGSPVSSPIFNNPIIPQSIVQIPGSSQVENNNVSVSKEDIQAIRSQLERTNATLTKMSGMLGKVFASFTEKNKNNQLD
jgi:hypothetical protein